MQISIKKKSIPNSENEITFLVKSNQLNEINISQEEKKYFLNKIKSSKKNIVSINRLNQNFILVNCDKEINNYKDSEFYRNIGHKLNKVLDSKYIINDEVNFNQEDLELIDENAKKIISDFLKEILKSEKPIDFR